MCLSYQTVLARLAWKRQQLNVSQIKIPVKNIAKVFSLYKKGVKSTLFLGKLHLMLA